jgi:hypothetical protein
MIKNVNMKSFTSPFWIAGCEKRARAADGSLHARAKHLLFFL